MLIDDNGCVRLTDFGLITISETVDFMTTTTQGDRGSLRWMAPELMISGGKKNCATDIYAFGMTIIEVKLNFTFRNSSQLFDITVVAIRRLSTLFQGMY